MRVWRWLLVALGLSTCGLFTLVFWPLHNAHPRPILQHGDLAIENVKIYTSPDAPPIERGTVLIEDGVIAAVGLKVDVPKEARQLSCVGCVVAAGFWNAHVHFTNRSATALVLPGHNDGSRMACIN